MRVVAALAFGGLVMLSAAVQGQAVSATLDRDALINALREGGVALLLRHAQTVPGVGDPPNFTIGDCKTQRNLSDVGVSQAKRIGNGARAAGVKFSKTMSSEWCRCRDTARLVAGQYVAWSPLNSFFDDASTRDERTNTVKQRLSTLKKQDTWLLVTHQVNITALTGISPAMGEGVVIRPSKDGIIVLGLLTL